MSRIAPFFFLTVRPVPARRSAKCTAEQTVDKLRLLACNDSWLGADSQPIRVKINSLCTVHRTSPDITGLQTATQCTAWRVENLWRDFHSSLSTRAFQWPISSEPLTKTQMFHLQPLWFWPVSLAECPSLLFSKAVQAVQRYVQTPNNVPHLQSDRVDSHSRSISNSRKWHIPIVLLHEHCPIYYTVLMKIYSIEFAKISVKGPFFWFFLWGFSSPFFQQRPGKTMAVMQEKPLTLVRTGLQT